MSGQSSGSTALTWMSPMGTLRFDRRRGTTKSPVGVRRGLGPDTVLVCLARALHSPAAAAVGEHKANRVYGPVHGPEPSRTAALRQRALGKGYPKANPA